MNEASVVKCQSSVVNVRGEFEEWMRLDVADGHASPLTLRCYAADVRQHLGWLDEQGVEASEVEPELIKGYRAWLVERYAVSTAARKLAAVRCFYELGTTRGALPKNPAARVRSPHGRTTQTERVKYLGAEEVRALLHAPRATFSQWGMRDRAMLVLMALHGLRVCEVSGLRLQDVNLTAEEAGTVRVLGKGAKWRTILLTAETREVVRTWIEARSYMRLQHERVFVRQAWNGTQYGPLGVRGIRYIVDGYLTQLGIKRPGVSCHSLRHSFATQALDKHADLLAISRALGHASVTTTQVYAEIIDKERMNPARVLGGLLS